MLAMVVVVARFSYRAPPTSTTLMMVVVPDQVQDDAGYRGVLQRGSVAGPPIMSVYFRPVPVSADAGNDDAGFSGPVLLPCRLGIGLPVLLSTVINQVSGLLGG